MRQICIAQCPEMDRNGLGYCVEREGEYCHTYTSKHGRCPIGNIPVWISFDSKREEHKEVAGSAGTD